MSCPAKATRKRGIQYPPALMLCSNRNPVVTGSPSQAGRRRGTPEIASKNASLGRKPFGLAAEPIIGPAKGEYSRRLRPSVEITNGPRCRCFVAFSGGGNMSWFRRDARRPHPLCAGSCARICRIRRCIRGSDRPRSCPAPAVRLRQLAPAHPKSRCTNRRSPRHLPFGSSAGADL
jgi:hypothetical protein